MEALKARLKGEENSDTRRHDEGAYYTPDEVTAYIIENTLNSYLMEFRQELGFETLPVLKESWLSDLTNKSRQKHITFWEAYANRLKKVKIIDPSCGSGAFLVAAFDYLMDEGARINKELERLQAPRLFTHPDRDILKNNLFGVDLSPEAVEITRLSLWLKIANSKDKLVSLDHNIRFGNAVAGFDWHAAFPDIMKAGGFDLVIGNPPYVRHELIRELKPELKANFKTYAGTADLYVYFYELAYELLKPGGYLGYISSNKWMRAGYGRKLWTFIKDKTTLITLIDLGEKLLFEGATTYTNIITLKKQEPVAHNLIKITDPPFSPNQSTLDQDKLEADGYNLESNPLFWSIKEKMDRVGTPLKEWDITIHCGVLTGFNEAFIIDTQTKELMIREDPKSAEILKPLLRGRDVERWRADWQGLWLIFTRRGINIDHYPVIKRHLGHYREQLAPRNNGEKIGRKPGDYQWYEIQDTVAYYQDFEKEKIVYSEIVQSGQFFLDRDRYYNEATSFYLIGKHINPSLWIVLLNADITSWYIEHKGTDLRGGYIRFKKYFSNPYQFLI